MRPGKRALRGARAAAQEGTRAVDAGFDFGCGAAVVAADTAPAPSTMATTRTSAHRRTAFTELGLTSGNGYSPGHGTR